MRLCRKTRKDLVSKFLARTGLRVLKICLLDTIGRLFLRSKGSKFRRLRYGVSVRYQDGRRSDGKCQKAPATQHLEAPRCCRNYGRIMAESRDFIVELGSLQAKIAHQCSLRLNAVNASGQERLR